MKLQAGLIVGLAIALPVDAHVAGGDALHAAILIIEDFRRREAGEDLDAESFGLLGHLTKILKRQFALDAECEPQVYGLGMKELWDINPEMHQPGLVIHSQGWPLTDAYGGGFLYHQSNGCLLYTSPSPRDRQKTRMPSSA